MFRSMLKFVKNRMRPANQLSLPEDVTAVEIGDDVAFICPVIVHRVNKAEMKNDQGIQDTIDAINHISRRSLLPESIATDFLPSPSSPTGFSPRRYQRNFNTPIRELAVNNNNHLLDEEKRATWTCLNGFLPDDSFSPSSMVENSKFLDSPPPERGYDSLPRATVCRDLCDPVVPLIKPPNRPAPKPVADFECQVGTRLELDFTLVETVSYEPTSCLDGTTPEEIRRQIEEIENYIYNSFTAEDVMHIIQKKIDDAVERTEKRVEKDMKEMRRDVKDIAKSVASNCNTLSTLRIEMGRKQRGSLGLDKKSSPSLFVPPPLTTPEDPISERSQEHLNGHQSDSLEECYRF